MHVLVMHLVLDPYREVGTLGFTLAKPKTIDQVTHYSEFLILAVSLCTGPTVNFMLSQASNFWFPTPPACMNSVL